MNFKTKLLMVSLLAGTFNASAEMVAEGESAEPSYTQVLVKVRSTQPTTMEFVKDGDPTVVLKFNSDGTASVIQRDYYIDIKKGEGALKPDVSLVEGKVKLEKNGDYRIEREEGDVCPDVSVSMVHDIVLGENQGAVVTVLTNEGGSANNLCSAAKVSGQFSRQ